MKVKYDYIDKELSYVYIFTNFASVTSSWQILAENFLVQFVYGIQAMSMSIRENIFLLN